MGKELKDDLFIYSYDIIDESTVQVMITKPKEEWVYYEYYEID